MVNRSAVSIAVLLSLVPACAGRTEPAADIPRDTAPPRPAGPNVLLICVDDLRPELGCYGRRRVKTPNIDRFAATARVFERHYVQVPTCGASRYALLTGRRPSAPASYGNWAFRLLRGKDTRSLAEDAPLPLPALFRRNGYRTVSIGKVSHQPDGTNRDKGKATGDGRPEIPESWDEVVACAGKWKSGWGAFFGYADGSTRVPGKTPATERADVGDTGYPDGLIADAAVSKLRELRDTPFFLAVGFYKPHLPFNAPAKYWDLYDRDDIELSPWPEAPSGVDPSISLHKSPELLKNYGQHPSGDSVDADYARRLRHAYLACVSYADAQVGNVLSALAELGLDEKTIVVLWGDHGWHLGDLGVWGKHTNHEFALHSPLIVRTPRLARPGRATRAIVESIDVYPTLAELCGLPAPDRLGGISFKPQLVDPAREGDGRAFGYWRRGKNVGHTLRTDRYRIVRWFRGGKVVQTELYDHESDPGETRNVAEAFPDITRRLSALVPAPRG